jgi:hypothetical protein
MVRDPPHLPLGTKFSEVDLESASDRKLEQLRNGLSNMMEGIEDKIKKSRQSVVKLTYELDLNDTKDCMAQLRKEITRRKQLRPKDK